MSEDPKNRRRWFSFSLRTLFVAITLFACLLGYEMNWIRQRRQVIASPNVQNGTHYLLQISLPTGLKTTKQYSIAPWPLCWMGETGYWAIGLPKGTSEDEVVRVRGLFPEAEEIVIAVP